MIRVAKLRSRLSIERSTQLVSSQECWLSNSFSASPGRCRNDVREMVKDGEGDSLVPQQLSRSRHDDEPPSTRERPVACEQALVKGGPEGREYLPSLVAVGEGRERFVRHGVAVRVRDSEAGPEDLRLFE